MRILGLDFETYYSQYYTLKSPPSTLNMSEYIRDPRFKAHGVSLQWEHEEPWWVSHTDLPDAFASIDWNNTALLCWNTPFDGLILHEHYGHTPRFYLDGRVMARLIFPRCFGVSLEEVCGYYDVPGKVQGTLEETKGIRDLSPEMDAELGEYACQDTQAMWDCFNLMLPHVPHDQLRLIHITTAMFTVPVLQVNLRLVRQEYNRHRNARLELFRKVSENLNIPYDNVLPLLQSTPKLANALESLGQRVPLKPSPAASKKGQMIPALAKTDLAFQALRFIPDQRVVDLVEARLQAKGSIGMTRATRIQNSARPALPVGLYYANPRTIRWAGTNKMNLQNLERGSLLRNALEAPKGWKINVVDLAQIEDRMNCWIAGHTSVLNEYHREGGDPYKQMAAQIYGIPSEKVKKQQRFVGKVARLSLGYQAGKDKFHWTLVSGQLGPPIEIERDESDRVHDIYRRANQPIVKLWRTLQGYVNAWKRKEESLLVHPVTGDVIVEFTFDDDARTIPTIILPDGNKMFYVDLAQPYDPATDNWGDITYQSSKSGRAKLYGGKLCENLCQALAKIPFADGVLKIQERYRILSVTHDEVWYLSHESEGLKPLKFGLQAFSTPRDWYHDLPLDAEGGQHKSYGKAKNQSLTLRDLT